MASTAPNQIDDFLGAKPRSRWRRWGKWIAIVVGVILLGLLARSCFAGDAAAEYSTAPVRRGDLRVTVSATGKLAPTNQVTVGSQLSGLVTRVVVDVNDRVTAGQPLALIDPEQIDDQIRAGEAQVNAQAAQVAQAEATVAEAQAQLRRLEEVRRLSGGRVPSDTELQTGRANAQRATATLRAAQANVASARAQLAQSQTQRQRAVIVSPVSGVVLARQVDPGQTVAASFNTPTLFVIAEDLSQMKLEVSIDEADVGEVKVGQRATFTVDAFPGRTFPAAITRVDLGSNQTVASASASSSSTASATTTAQVVSYAADLSVANPTLQLRPGMTATADIVTSEKKNVLLVPNAALRFRPPAAASGSGGPLQFGPPRRRGTAERQVTAGRGARQTVYVRNADGTPRAITVVTGNSDGSMTEVTGGDLKPNMQVITGQLSSDGAGGGGAAGGQRKGGGGGQRGQ
jgi:HlyD family secretion protein